MSVDFPGMFLPGAVVAIWACLLIACFVQEARIFRHLRLRHPTEWEALGRPSGIRRFRNREVGQFLKKGGYRRLGDERLNSMLGMMRILSWTNIAAFIAVLALFVIPSV